MLLVDEFDYGNYKTYTILKGDTLLSVAQKLEIEPFKLRQAHNRFCPIEDLIEADFKSHLKFVILPEENDDSAKEKIIQKVQFANPDFTLPFRPGTMDESYAVLYTIQKGESIQTIEQKFNIKRIKPEIDQQEYHFFKVDKISELYIDGKLADTKAAILSEKISNVIYPLRIVTDDLGKWIDINSYQNIKNRWEETKEEIRDIHEGKTVEDCIDNVEEVINDNDRLIENISSNWFLRAFFNGIHVAYTDKLEIDKKVYFPVMAEVDDLEFLLTQKVNPYLNGLNQIEVTQEGETENEYLFENYKAKYFLNANNYRIECLELECYLEMSASRKINISIKNLDESKIELDSGVSLLV